MIEALSPDAFKALTGIWAMVSIAIVPFAWGWDGAPDWAGGGRPKFDGSVLFLAVMWPVIPFAIVCLPVLAVLAFLTFPTHVRRVRAGGSVTEVQTYTAKIYIGGDYGQAKNTCQRYCAERGLCVTVEAVEYVYTGGCEAGVRVGLINYARFPAEPSDIFAQALDLARVLRVELGQHSFSIVATDKTIFDTTRAA